MWTCAPLFCRLWPYKLISQESVVALAESGQNVKNRRRGGGHSRCPAIRGHGRCTAPPDLRVMMFGVPKISMTSACVVSPGRMCFLAAPGVSALGRASEHAGTDSSTKIAPQTAERFILHPGFDVIAAMERAERLRHPAGGGKTREPAQ